MLPDMSSNELPGAGVVWRGNSDKGLVGLFGALEGSIRGTFPIWGAPTICHIHFAIISMMSLFPRCGCAVLCT